jgi:uncharacterized repeat protein (TIGR01451 family)
MMITVRGSKSFRTCLQGPARLGLVCLALSLGVKAEGGIKPQDGAWTGTTSQGQPYEFTVKNGGSAISPLKIGCSGTGFTVVTTFYLPEIPIGGSAFSFSGGSCPVITTNGIFTSTTTANGAATCKFTPSYTCPFSGTINATWTATKAPPQADLAVVKTDNKTSVVAGAANTYTITVTNNGPEPVSSLTLTDARPTTLLNPVFTPSAGAYDPATGAWTGLSLASGQSVVLTLSATVSPGATGTLTNTATVSPPAGISDPTTGNNSSTDTDSVTVQADVGITKTGPGLMTAPSGLTYQIVVRNNGPSDASGVVVADTTPDGLTFLSNTGSCTSAFPCSLGTVPAGQSRTIGAGFYLPADYAGPDPISNTASVTTTTPDPNGANDTSTVTTQVVPPGPATGFYTVEPCRLLDTREANGPLGGPALVAGQDRTFVAVGSCGVPATATAISVNVTATASTVGGNLRLYPGGQPLPLVSTINYVAGQTRANNAIVGLNAAGEFTIRCAQASGTAHAIVDVNGYFEPTPDTLQAPGR